MNITPLFKLCILVLSLSVPTGVLAQRADGIVERLVDMGFENVAQTDTPGERIIALENSAWKLNPAGIRAALEAIGADMGPGSKPCRVIVLKNNVPQISLYCDPAALGDSAAIAPGAWEASYRLDGAWQEVRRIKPANRSLFKVDIVVTPEFHFRNIKLEKPYDIMINLSPALQISFWKGMMLTAQVIVPIYTTGYDPDDLGRMYYSKVRPGYITLSQQFRLPRAWFMQATIGTFNKFRWGADLRAFHPFRNERFALLLRAGLVGSSTFWNWKWHYTWPKTFVASVGGQYYMPRFNLQFNVNAARYMMGDYGARIDMTRHFRNVSIGVYAQRTTKIDINGGFHFAIALPPYRYKRNRGIRATTSDYFYLEYNAAAYNNEGAMYRTDPGENWSQNNFNPYYIKSEL
ncbi:MAG: YjbH domain-containing protein [Rikenellaceae bacterium]|nr:YjbH domain-containing protein [Rikenellaceae bacterium]